MRTAAGRAFLQLGRIDLNPRLLEHSLESIVETYLHEVAHLLCHPSVKHGAPWVEACARLGIPANVYHDHDNMERRKPWVATCPRCGRTFRKGRDPRKRRWFCRQDKTFLSSWTKEPTPVRRGPKFKLSNVPSFSIATLAWKTYSREANSTAA